VRIAVISDTHFPTRGTRLPEACLEFLGCADLILHAGDFSTVDALAAVRGLGPPVIAVRGNVDDAAVRRALPPEVEVDLSGHRLAMVHDAGPARERMSRLRKRYPSADVVVFGHSHVPVVEQDPDGFTIVNPGSPTDRRRQLHHTMAVIDLLPGRAAYAQVVILDGPERSNN
jgi:putative phosphoesterase